jgi:hypothetical protein
VKKEKLVTKSLGLVGQEALLVFFSYNQFWRHGPDLSNLGLIEICQEIG